jgi:hypothetical protein
MGDMAGLLQHPRFYVSEREVGDRVPAGLVKQHHIVAHRDRPPSELDPQPAAQRLGVEQPLRKWFSNKEATVRRPRQRTLLPRKTHLTHPVSRNNPSCRFVSAAARFLRQERSVPLELWDDFDLG